MTGDPWILCSAPRYQGFLACLEEGRYSLTVRYCAVLCGTVFPCDALCGTVWRFADLSREPGRFEIPCKGMPRSEVYAAGRDGVRSCGAGRGLAREGAGKCPRVWWWAPPWGYP